MSAVKISFIRLLTLCLLSFLLLSSCVKPAHNIVTIEGKSAEQVRQSLLQQSAQRQRLTGLIHIDYIGTEGLFKGDADFALERPRHLRMSLRSFFGQPLASLASDGKQLVFVDSRSMQVRCGPVDDPQLRDVLPGGLALEQTTAAMLGSLALPQLPKTQTSLLQYFPPLIEGHVALRWMSAEVEIIIETDAKARHLLSLRHIERRKQIWWKLQFSHYEESKFGAFPRQAELSWSDQRGRLRWRWKDFVLNPTQKPEAFWQLQLPAGYARLGSCQDSP